MIYNVKRIYICLSDIFKLFQDFFKRNSGNHSSPHQIPHNPTFYDKMPHKEEKYILLLKTLSRSRRARRRWSPLLNILQHKNLYFTSFNALCKLLSGILDVRLRKSFYLQPIGNITVCNRKSPVFGIYVIARLYAIFVCFSLRRFAGFLLNFSPIPIDCNITVFYKNIAI